MFGHWPSEDLTEETTTNNEDPRKLHEDPYRGNMSGATTPTTGSLSEEDSFFEAIGADIRTLAASLRDTAGGVAHFVHKSALSVAAEIARLEDEDRQREEGLLPEDIAATEAQLKLPWEVQRQDKEDNDSVYLIEDEILKERILDISKDDRSFLMPATINPEGGDIEFILDEPHIQLIRRLLEIDGNLAATHARLSGRSDVRETVFWGNYFDRCEQCRIDYLGKECVLSTVSSSPKLTDPELTQDNDALVPVPDGEDSLVPAEGQSLVSGSHGESTGSFVIPSPPVSANSADVHSVNSLVFVDAVKKA